MGQKEKGLAVLVVLAFVAGAWSIETYGTTQRLAVLEASEKGIEMGVFGVELLGKEDTWPRRTYDLATDFDRRWTKNEYCRGEVDKEQLRDDLLHHIDYLNDLVAEDDRNTTVVILRATGCYNTMSSADWGALRTSMEFILVNHQDWYLTFRSSFRRYSQAQREGFSSLSETAVATNAITRLPNIPFTPYSGYQQPSSMISQALPSLLPSVFNSVNVFEPIEFLTDHHEFVFRFDPLRHLGRIASHPRSYYIFPDVKQEYFNYGKGSEDIWDLGAETLLSVGQSHHPCIAYGIEYTDTAGRTWMGTGDGLECRALVYGALLMLTPPIGSMITLPIGFLLTDQFWDTTTIFYEAPLPPDPYDYVYVYAVAAAHFCEIQRPEFVWEPYKPVYGEDYASLCFLSTYLSTLLSLITSVFEPPFMAPVPSYSGGRGTAFGEGIAQMYFFFLEPELLQCHIDTPYTGERDNSLNFDFREMVDYPPASVL